MAWIQDGRARARAVGAPLVLLAALAMLLGGATAAGTCQVDDYCYLKPSPAPGCATRECT
jgi:hypothetical protein